MIKVTNKMDNKLNVSISHWSDFGDTSKQTISPEATLSWERTDSRGFVMYVTSSIYNDGPYYVLANAEVSISESGVTGATKV